MQQENFPEKVLCISLVPKQQKRFRQWFRYCIAKIPFPKEPISATDRKKPHSLRPAPSVQGIENQTKAGHKTEYKFFCHTDVHNNLLMLK